MTPHAIETIKQYASADGDKVKLNCGQLDRDLYEQVNLVFERFRGKWVGGKTSAHVFPYPITGQVVIDSILAGNIPPKNPYDLFPTPDSVVDMMMNEVLNNFPNQDKALRFLEPSAGTGAIARRLREAYPNATIDCIEIDPINVRILQQQGFTPIHDNFDTFVAEQPYDAVVMNPPFAGTTYIDHIAKAISLTARHGLVVAIAPMGLTFQRSDKVRQMLAKLHHHCGTIEELPKDAFKESGTGVGTLLLAIPADEPEHLPATGYASRRIANLLMNADNDYELYKDMERLIQRTKSVAVDMTGTVTDAKFISDIKRLYEGWMERNVLNYYAILDQWEWVKIASDVVEEYNIATVSQVAPEAKPAPKQPSKPVSKPKAKQPAELVDLPLFA